MKLKKFTQKDRYGNMRSFEFDIAEGQMEVPPMTSSIPMYDHPGEPKGTDTVPAWLTPGEFVVNKEATDIYGPVIKQMNDVGREIQDMKPEYAAEGKEVLDNQRKIYKHLKNKDLSDKAIAAIMGNINHETGGTFDFQQKEIGAKPEDQGYGLIQLTPGPQRLLSPYMNWLINKYDIKPNEASEGVPVSIRNKIMAKDSPENQLDFMLDAIYTKGGVPNPNNEDGYFIGPGNARDIRTVLNSPKASLEDMSSIIVNNMLNPGEKDLKPKQYKDRIKDSTDMYSLIESGSLDPVDPGLAKTLKDKFKDVGITMPSVSDIPNPLNTIKEKAGDVLENLFKRSPTVGKNLYNDGGAVHLDPGGQVYGGLDKDTMDLIFGINQKADNLKEDMTNNLSSLGQQFDSTSMADNQGSLTNTFEIPKPFGMEDPNLMEAMEEVGTIKGVPSYDPQGLGGGVEMLRDIPAFEDPAEDNILGGIGQDDVPPTPAPLPATKEFGFDFTTDDFRKRKPDAVQNEIQTIDKRLNVLTDQATNASGDKLDRIRADIQKLENNRETALNALMKAQAVSPDQSELYKDLSTQGDLRKELVAAKNIVDDVNATESEKIKAQKKYDNTLQQLPQPNIVEQKATLKNAANQIDDTTSNEISNKLATNEGKANLTTNTDPKNPNVQKAKEAMKFLFGDLIDAKEIGRAAAVYLGSRALGYDHNSSINYVAKQYLKRVDAKTAQIDKYIADNSDKFEATSLQAFKDSRGDYTKLMPKGAKIRSTGERKPWFGKDTGPSGKMAYQFKMKTGEGDLTYWSFDINGKSRIGSGYSDDGTKVKESAQFNEAARKKIPNIKDQMEELLNKHARKQTGKNKTTGAFIYEDYTNLTPANSAEEIAFWAQENGISLQRLGPGLKMAVIAAAKNFTNPADGKPPSKAESLLPYLEEATIKQRLDMMVPGLTQAKVGDEVVKIDTDTLININDRVKSVSRDINQFYNEAADIWNNRGKDNNGKAKGINPDTGKLWRKEYEEAAKKPGNEGLTPYALFVIDITNKLSGVN